MPELIKKMCQIGGTLIMVSVFFLLLSVSAYVPNDRAWNHYASQDTVRVHNYGGWLGAILADGSLQVVGSAIVLWGGLLSAVGWFLTQRRLRIALAVGWRGFVVLTALGMLLHLTLACPSAMGETAIVSSRNGWFVAWQQWGESRCVPIMFAGGMLGAGLAETCRAYLAGFGACLVAIAAASSALCLGNAPPVVIRIRTIRHVLRRLSTQTVRQWRWVAPLLGRGFQYTRMGSVWGLARLRRVVARATLLGRTALPAPRPADAAAPQGPWGTADFTGNALEVVPTVGYGRRVRSVEIVPSLSVLEVDEALQAPQRSAALGGSQPEDVEEEHVPHLVERRHVPEVLPALWQGEGPVATSPQVLAPPESTPVPLRVQAESVPPYAASPAAPARHAPQSRAPVHEVQDPEGTHLPSVALLDRPPPSLAGHSPEELAAQARFLEQKLREFGVEGEVVQVLPGPVITVYEFAPAAGVKVNKIVALQDDLALVMEALSVRVVAPIPGKAVVGIEIPHKHRETICLRDLLDSDEFRTSPSQLSMALGKDVLGTPVITDLALIPHLLIAGATGSGKSVGLNSLICSMLLRATPAEVKMLMIDPKMLEFSVYDGIPHLLTPVVTDPKKAALALRRVVEEMGRRYQLLAARGVRSIAQYNQQLVQGGAPQGPAGRQADAAALEPLPYLVVIIDELSDLMMVSARDVEDALMRLAQMARAAGIHLIVATQRPSVDVLTGVIKANFPARLSFQVTSKVDSRTILDTNGAEQLLGRGDMLFLAPGTSKPQRIHGAYVAETEIQRLVEAWKAYAPPRYDTHFLATGDEQTDVEEAEYDEKYDEAIELVTKTGQASISMLQRRLRVGYNRAARMIEMMERDGVVGAADGIKPRVVFVRKTYDDV